MSLRLAKLEEVKEICRAFQQFEKRQKEKGLPPVFAFVRHDYLKRCVEDGTLYYDDGVIAVLKQYKVKTKYGSRKGDWCMPEVLSVTDNPLKVVRFYKRALAEKVKEARLYGTIRNDNKVSLDFHTALGYKRVGEISWSNGTLPGGVYVYEKDDISA